MKAKQHAERYIQNPSPETAGAILGDFIDESIELMRTRNCRTDSAHAAVFKEQDIKWKAFARHVNEHFQEDRIRREGFKDVLHEAFQYDEDLGRRLKVINDNM